MESFNLKLLSWELFRGAEIHPRSSPIDDIGTRLTSRTAEVRIDYSTPHIQALIRARRNICTISYAYTISLSASIQPDGRLLA